MAKNILVLRGAVTSTTTLYTVPAGRTAKVSISFFNVSGQGANLIIGSYNLVSETDSAYGGKYPYANSGLIVMYNAPQNMYVAVPDVVYLAAGDTIQIVTGGNQCRYNFSVVEEY